MCLAVPMKLIRRDDLAGEVELDGVRREVSLLMLPDVQPGDFVLIHAGFAIGKVDEAEAEATIALLREIGDQGDVQW
jgi:hydrogenase expression/formation protein HypC